MFCKIIHGIAALAVMLLPNIGLGQIYPEVKIGKQVWMSKNLDVSTFRNGDPIPHAKTDEEWEIAARNKKPAWCYYDNNTTNGTKYGKLYNWHAVNDPRGLAPEGWMIPGEQGWDELHEYLGGSNGERLKSRTNWIEEGSFPGNGTNSSGFNGFPGGCRYTDGKYSKIGKSGFWWSSRESDDENNAKLRGLSHRDFDLNRFYGAKGDGYSVRCIKGDFFERSQRLPQKLDSQCIMFIGEFGVQKWSKKNLSVDTFRNGDKILQAKSAKEWEWAYENKQPAWCYFTNDSNKEKKYGRLYNWYAVNDPRGLAPKGWRIPSEGDWQILTDYLGGDKVAAKKLKSKTGYSKGGAFGPAGPYNYNYNGTNSSGFNGYPNGWREPYSEYRGEDDLFRDGKGYWWCSSWLSNSEEDETAMVFELNDYETVYFRKRLKGYGLSVRCIKK